MAKFLNLWSFNPTAPWPTDPVETLKLSDMMYAELDKLLQTGELQEFGFFLDGTSGYAIAGGESKDTFKRVYSFYPFIESEVHEIVPYETGKEVARGVLKAKAEAMKR